MSELTQDKPWTIEDYIRQREEAADVITDGRGNIVNRKCPRCGSKSVARTIQGTCKCLRCGK